MTTFVSFFYGKWNCFFFSLANERESDPVKKCVLARHIVYVLVIELAVLMAHGNKGALQKHHISTRALPPCGHRSKATMGLRKKGKYLNLVLTRGDNKCVFSVF